MIKVTVTVEASSKEEACDTLEIIKNRMAIGFMAGFRKGFKTGGNYDFWVEREIDRADNGPNGGDSQKNK